MIPGFQNPLNKVWPTPLRVVLPIWKLCSAERNRRLAHTLETKLGKFATEIGPAALQALGYNNKAEFVHKKLYVLRSYP